MAERPPADAPKVPEPAFEVSSALGESGVPAHGALPPRGPLPSYGRFDAPVTQVDDKIEKRIAAMKQGDKWPEEFTTGVAPRPVAPSTTAELLPPPAPVPSFPDALKQRVRFAGGELPLWSVLAPALVAFSVLVSLAAAAATARDVVVPAPLEVPSATASAIASTAPVPVSKQPELVQPAPAPAPAASSETPKQLTLVERAARGQADALKTLAGKPLPELSVEEALALSSGHAEQELAAARSVREKLARDPALIKNASVLSELFRYTQDPLTAREALAAIAAVPGPISADMLFEVWTGTPTKTDTTELARSLLLGKAMRAKASPALAAALDLRLAERCEDTQAVLLRVIQDGDKRSFVTLNKLQRKSGCGANKRLDCYPCLRKGTELKDALKAVRQKREPQPFQG